MPVNPKVLFLPTNAAPVNFWRMYQYWHKMKEKGIDAYIYNFDPKQETCGEWEAKFANDTDEALRNNIYGMMNHADVIVMGYIHHPKMLALIMMYQEEFGKKILCEIDDQIIDLPAFNPAYRQGLTAGSGMERLIIEQLKVSNGIITTTEHLKDKYEQFNSNIHIIPNCIDFRFWDVNKTKSSKTRIGWIGGGNHDDDLLIMKQVIPDILLKYPDVEFCFVHGIPNFLKDMAKKDKRIKLIRAWSSIDKYPQFLAKQGFDIGIAPLVVNSFNKSKSNLKWLEYSALSIPTVATNIETYSKFIKHGKTGYLCNDADGWVDNLSLLIEDKKKRREIGDNAYISIMDDYNLDKVTNKYIKVLKGI